MIFSAATSIVHANFSPGPSYSSLDASASDLDTVLYLAPQLSKDATLQPWLKLFVQSVAGTKIARNGLPWTTCSKRGVSVVEAAVAADS
jgi:hypothetical protein